MATSTNADTSDLSSAPYTEHVKALRLPGGTTYRYVHIAPQTVNNKKPYILFVHGYPSSSYDWRHQIAYFSAQGYGVIAPDLLGYGGTDKPMELEAYRYKKMAEEIIGIVDHEVGGSGRVLGVAHDWGCVMLSRLANYHPDRFLSYAFLDIAYFPPGPGLDYESIKALNQKSLETFGYEVFGYWLFNDQPDAAKILDDHMESLHSLTYPEDANLWKTNMCPVGAIRAWVMNDRKLPRPSYISEEEKATHIKIFRKNGGYGPALNWYKSALHNVNAADEKDLPSDRATLRGPVLLVVGLRNPITIPDVAEQGTRKYAGREFTVKRMDAGHWVQLERRDEINKVLSEFFGEILSSGGSGGGKNESGDSKI